ncbi:MAG: ATP-binding cassette domain-containing protein [Rhodospirillales bacterium]|nr:ATP-binding cassette domain-containing protein [Rhodospirillales bacterium]
MTNVASVIWNMLIVIVYVALMILLSWKMTVVSVVFMAVISYLLKLYSAGPLRRAGKALSEQNGRINENIFETITGMKLIRLSAAERLMEKLFTKNVGDLIETETLVIKYSALTSPFLSTAVGVFVCVLLFGGSVLGNESGNWLGSLLMFLFLLMRLLAPVSNINVARYRIINTMYFLDQIENFHMEANSKAQKSGKKDFEFIDSKIEFKNVVFSYPNTDESAISNLDLRIPKGKMTAIVGPSGSGKNTLISLLTRFYDPQSGSINIGGTPIEDFNISDLRRNISVVSQDIFIFNNSISRNISFSMEGVSQDDIIRAAKLAAADEFIQELPEGYDTKVGDRGMKLSGGQQQRIAIARAILRNPEILIMDEATSQLDTYTEKAVQNAVETLRENRTVLVIAHRLSTIRRADKVVVLSKGQVVEEGSLNELMDKKGIFWNMVSHQNMDLIEENEPSVAVTI